MSKRVSWMPPSARSTGSPSAEGSAASDRFGTPFMGRRNALASLRQWARGLKTEVHALYLACRDPRVPWYAKAIAVFVVAYALSPIDLIPDFVPVLGYLDDLIIVPLGIWLARRMIPAEVMSECRAAPRLDTRWHRPRNYAAAAAIVTVWLGAVLMALYWFLGMEGAEE